MKAARQQSAALRRNLWFALNRRAFRANGSRRPRLLVDVSVIAQNDARTGIQRVVRAIWSELKRRKHHNLEVVPVYARATHGYRLARWDCLDERPVLTRQVVAAGQGDIFLGLDLSAHYIPHCEEQLAAWRKAGAVVHFVIYDLLPLQAPQWFTEASGRHFARWFDTVQSHADGVICISDDVAGHVRQKFGSAGPAVRRLFLSGELSRSRPTKGLCKEALSAAEMMAAGPAVLMVGTLEPRKGHQEVLDAFEEIWSRPSQPSPALVLAGKPGWKTEALQTRILAHPEFGKKLFWLRSATDEALELLFTRAKLVMVASHAEGFGLPVVEAAQHRRWVLARDLPVFREQQLSNVRYFQNAEPEALADTIETVLAEAAATEPSEQALLTWSDCANLLLIELGVNSPVEAQALVLEPDMTSAVP